MVLCDSQSLNFSPMTSSHVKVHEVLKVVNRTVLTSDTYHTK